MITVKVSFSDNSSLVTGFNGTISDAIKYYVDNQFNLGTGEHDKMAYGLYVQEVGSK